MLVVRYVYGYLSWWWLKPVILYVLLAAVKSNHLICPAGIEGGAAGRAATVFGGTGMWGPTGSTDAVGVV